MTSPHILIKPSQLSLFFNVTLLSLISYRANELKTRRRLIKHLHIQFYYYKLFDFCCPCLCGFVKRPKSYSTLLNLCSSPGSMFGFIPFLTRKAYGFTLLCCLSLRNVMWAVKTDLLNFQRTLRQRNTVTKSPKGTSDIKV